MMGGSSSSRTKSVTNTDNRQLAVQDGIGAFSEGDTNIKVSDFGAINRSLDTADRSLDTADRALDRSLQSVDDTNTKAFSFGSKLQDEISGTTREAFNLVNEGFRRVSDLASNSVRGESGEVADTTKTALYVGGAVAVFAIVYAIMRKN
jgi:hypothetical protein